MADNDGKVLFAFAFDVKPGTEHRFVNTATG